MPRHSTRAVGATDARALCNVEVSQCLLPPPRVEVKDFMRRLFALHIDAKYVDWSGEPVSRMNALAMVNMIAKEIERK